MKKTTVFCTFKVEGVHRWANCPFPEVAYLRDLHRHMFWVKCVLPVNHDDRDIEFIMAKHQIKRYLENKYHDVLYKCCKFDNMSCEMIASELLDEFDLLSCEVSEDGENGAVVYKE